MDYSLIFTTILLTCFSILLIASGIYMLGKRRPIIFSSFWFMIGILLILLPSVLTSFTHFDPKEPSGYILSFMFILVPLVFWYMFRSGYFIIGIDTDTFQQALFKALEKKQYRFKSSLSMVEIEDPPMRIHISLQSWNGTGQVKLKGRRNTSAFRQLVSSIETKELGFNSLTPIIYMIIGLLMGVIVFT